MAMKHLLPFALLVVLSTSCSKSDPVNPFDQVDPPMPPDTTGTTPDMRSIAGLHARIFVPTCANSGCHDGTFEPDFRTIESSYNTLVYHPIIKNDPQGSYQFRVVPGNPDASQLMARLTYDIDGQSGLMPLVVDPGAEWNTHSQQFVQYIRDWIQDGARDIFGQSYSLLDAVPYMRGVMGQVQGQPMERAEGGAGALRIPQSVTQLSLYFSLADDKTLPQNLGVNQIRFAQGPDDFAGRPPLTLEVLDQPVNGKGFTESQVAFTHRITIDPRQYASLGQTIFFRIYVQDSSNPVTEIPTNAGVYYIKNYFSFTIIE
jgi:hypothetical protein